MVQVETVSVRSELAATTEQVAAYRNEIAGLAASEKDVKAKLEQLVASHVSEIQDRVSQAVKTCDERHKREDAPKSVSLLRCSHIDLADDQRISE